MNSAKGPLAGRYLSRGTTTQVDRLFIFPNPFAFFVFRLERQNSLELYDRRAENHRTKFTISEGNLRITIRR